MEILAEPTYRKFSIAVWKNYAMPTARCWQMKDSRKNTIGCKIYLKREDLNHTGAHKINNAIGQVLLARRMGKKRIIAETGAGQHGVATATVCALMGMECVVYMGKTDVERQRVNVERMQMLGARVEAVTSGNMTLKDATNEAIRDWCCHPADTYYVIGSTVGPHPYPDMVARLQSVISKEIKKQLMEHEGRDYPDYLMACVGGGSNAAGTIYHYLDDERVKIILAEAGGKGVETGLSAADEMLYPDNFAYLEDVLSYVAVGARSSENQQHRLVASGVDVPVGVKNPMFGSFPVLLNSIYAAQIPNEFKYNDSQVKTGGNPYAHAVLRGAVDSYGNNIPNYHYEDIIRLYDMYVGEHLKNPAVIIDTNHSNSNKRPMEQIRIVKEVLSNMKVCDKVNSLVKGFLIESYIEDGNQPPDGTVYGKSITDGCLGWSKTERLILDVAEAL